MISAYNRSKIVRSILCLLGSAVCFVLAWLFFRYSSALVLKWNGGDARWSPWMASIALMGLCVSGYYTWRRGQGFQSYSESALHHDFGSAADTGGAYAVDHYARQITGPAYVLSQIFMGGPLLLLRGIVHLRQRVRNEAGLETKLEHALSVLRRANKWQSITEYPDLEREILLLGQMKRIDFSAHKGVPRIKALPSDGI